VNSSFDFANIRAGGEGLPLTSSQDLFWFAPFIERDGGGNPGRAARLDIGPLTAERVARIVEAVSGQIEGQPDEGWPCRSRSYLIELLFLLQRIRQAAEASALPERAEDAEGMEKVILYLYENYGRKVTIGELASAFNTNRTTIMGAFSKATGTSIKDYLIGIRIRFAASLIRDTMLPLSEIMERVGFNDFPHFSKTFRERVGCPPSEYRQRNCWMLSMYPDYRD
jgi:AraC family L-rhamnose operon regulatory protein RhaS